MARNPNGEIDEIWADTGDTAIPPVTFDEGWDVSYSQTGGPKPERTSFNFLLKQLYSMGKDISSFGGSLPWSNTIDFEVDAIVTYSGTLYVSLQNSGPSTSPEQPDISPTFWKEVGATTSFLTNREYFIASGTFNVPSDITTVRVTVAGGGGGGSTAGVSPDASAGGNSSFDGTVIATGGLGGLSQPDSSTQNGIDHQGGSGGDVVIVGGGGAGGIGSVWDQSSTDRLGMQGSNGGLVITDYTVTPSSSVSVVVGAGGAGSTGASGGTGSDGTDGYVIVEW